MKTRAIVTFVEDKNFLIVEIFNLYKSCLVSKVNTNTDLIICAPESMWDKLPQDSFVILLPTESISKDNCTSCNIIWQGYHFVNSIHCLVEHKEYLSKYQYILKTDCDVFLTENFLNFFSDKFYTGTGAYCNGAEVKSKLTEIAKRKGYRHQGIHDIGATWYGKSNLILNSCELTMTILENILGNEFKDGVGKWPGWFRGVSSMYASEIAVNHVVDNFTVSTLFDAPSDSDTLWKTTGVYHIHCWHTNTIYSKYKFIDGKYDEINPDTLNDQKTNEYCLKIALSNLTILKPFKNTETITTTTLPPITNLATIYNNVINDKNIDIFELFADSNTTFPFVYVVLIIIATLSCLLLFVFYLKKKK